MSACEEELVRARAFSYYPQLGRVLNYCAGNYQCRITLEKAAAVASLERTYFSSFFRSKVGVCFSCWFGLFRTEIAKQLMRERDYAIAHVAHHVGYQTLGTFERAFKRHTGMTPSQKKDHVRPC